MAEENCDNIFDRLSLLVEEARECSELPEDTIGGLCCCTNKLQLGCYSICDVITSPSIQVERDDVIRLKFLSKYIDIVVENAGNFAIDLDEAGLSARYTFTGFLMRDGQQVLIGQYDCFGFSVGI